MKSPRGTLEQKDLWRLTFLNQGQSISTLEIEKMNKAEAVVGWKRAIVQFITFVQVFGIYIPVLSQIYDRTTVAGAVRTLGVLLCLGLSTAMGNYLNRRTKMHEAITASINFKVCVFVCEVPLLSVDDDYTIPMVFGFVTLFLTIITLVILILMYVQVQPICDDLVTEEFYTKYVMDDFKEQSNSVVALKKALSLDARMEAPAPDDRVRQQSGKPSPSSAQADMDKDTLLERWSKGYLVRRELYRTDDIGHKIITVLFLILLILLFAAIIYEFSKIFMNQDPLFDQTLLSKYNDPARVKKYFPNVSHQTWKVHIVVVDGLRYDLTNPGKSDLANYIASPGFQENSQRFLSRAQLPSFSVPNWMSILTGAPPENHGVTGNLNNDETKFDNIFTQASNYNLGRGMTGTPWWKQLVFGSLSPLDSDGTVDASFTPRGWPTYSWLTADPADHVRLSVSLKAIAKSNLDPAAYKLFLTHFSDVDKQGHEYGISTKWNKLDTYMKAITNKTDAIMKIVDTLGNDTLLIITSDHGHVQRGGHGGVSTELRDTPLIFFTKNKRMNLPKPTLFASNLGPNYGTYQNLDISSTITALLGIPAPRQSQGICVEEIVKAYVPAEVQNLHWYDLFMAKRDAFMIYYEQVFPWEDDPSTVDVLGDADIMELTKSDPNKTDPMLYANGIRKILIRLGDLRDYRLNFILIRNLVGSLIVFFTVLVMLVSTYDRHSMVTFRSLITKDDPSCLINRSAFTIAFISVFMYYALSISTFIIGYFAVTGYDLWDSTLAHTPSVAGTYVLRTIIAPIIFYVLIFRGVTGPAIEWRVKDIFRSLQLKPKPSVQLIATWLQCIFSDISTIIFGTRDYQVEKYAFCYLYVHYSICWATFAAQFLLLLSFPYSFIYPVALSTSHVTEFNLLWRFRILTLQIITAPMLCGLIVQHHMRPVFKDKTLLLWDTTFLSLVCHSDLYRLNADISASTNNSEEQQDLKKRKAALDEAIELLQDPLLKFGSGHLMEMIALSKMQETGGPMIHPAPGEEKEMVQD
eukprot:PhF_6_TR29401/c0_g1_i1/m.43404